MSVLSILNTFFLLWLSLILQLGGRGVCRCGGRRQVGGPGSCHCSVVSSIRGQDLCLLVACVWSLAMVFGHAPFAWLAGVRSGCCGLLRGIWGWLLRGGALRGVAGFCFVLVLAEFLFWRGHWALGYYSMKF